jgi:hypothetical protein
VFCLLSALFGNRVHTLLLDFLGVSIDVGNTIRARKGVLFRVFCGGVCADKQPSGILFVFHTSGVFNWPLGLETKGGFLD